MFVFTITFVNKFSLAPLIGKIVAPNIQLPNETGAYLASRSVLPLVLCLCLGFGLSCCPLLSGLLRVVAVRSCCCVGLVLHVNRQTKKVPVRTAPAAAAHPLLRR